MKRLTSKEARMTVRKSCQLVASRMLEQGFGGPFCLVANRDRSSIGLDLYKLFLSRARLLVR